jgi:MFS family permease
VSPAAIGRRTFAALANPNYRRWYAGQGISLVGTWMQTIAQGWLVYTLSGSGTELGLVVALQMLPVLIFAPYAGVIADRVDKRRLIIAVQAVMGVLALILGVLTVTGAVRLWHVFVLAAALGVATAFDNPARQSFVMELVGTEHVRNAVTLNSVLVNAARAVGPAMAGILIATVGVSVCFLVNAGTYTAVIASLLLLDRSALRPSVPAPRSRGQLREGLRYVAGTPALAVPLAMMAVIGGLAYEFQVVLPIVARETFGGGAEVYGFMTAAMGAGAVMGGLVIAGSGRTGTRAVILASVGFGVAILLAAAAPTLPIELIALTVVGAASVTFLAVGNSTLQLASRPDMRGRVMSLWAVAFLGTTPIGGPIAGYVAENAGGRAGLLLGGVACIVAAATAASFLSQRGRAVLARQSLRQT